MYHLRAIYNILYDNETYCSITYLNISDKKIAPLHECGYYIGVADVLDQILTIIETNPAKIENIKKSINVVFGGDE